MLFEFVWNAFSFIDSDVLKLYKSAIYNFKGQFELMPHTIFTSFWNTVFDRELENLSNRFGRFSKSRFSSNFYRVLKYWPYEFIFKKSHSKYILMKINCLIRVIYNFIIIFWIFPPHLFKTIIWKFQVISIWFNSEIFFIVLWV